MPVLAQGSQHGYGLAMLTDCSAGELFDALKAPGGSAPGAPAARENITTGISLLHFRSPNLITQEVDSSAMTIVNTTQVGHEFYWGQVKLQVVGNPGNTAQIDVTGTGRNSSYLGALFNDIAGVALFGFITSNIQTGCAASHGHYVMPPG